MGRLSPSRPPVAGGDARPSRTSGAAPARAKVGGDEARRLDDPPGALESVEDPQPPRRLDRLPAPGERQMSPEASAVRRGPGVVRGERGPRGESGGR